MKFLKQLSLFALLAVLAFASCKKDELFVQEGPDEVTPTEHHVNGLITRSVTGAEGLDLGCFSIDYPFQMVLLDSSIADIASEDDFLNALSDETNLPLDFVYPLNVTDGEGNTLTVNDVDELAELFTDCVPETGWCDEGAFPAWVINFQNSCYQLVYPVTLLDTDSATVAANDQGELIALLSDGNIYSFAFPLGLEDVDGNTVTANDDGELFDLLAACGPTPNFGAYGIGTYGCFQLGYPLTVSLIDGSTLVVNNDDEFAIQVFSYNLAGFVYPLTLIDDDGNEFVVNTEEEGYEALVNGCGWPGGGGGSQTDGDFLCYDFVYPFSVIDINSGTTISFNTEDDFNTYITANPQAEFDFVYPISLTKVDTGVQITVNDEMELSEAIVDCF